MKLNPTVLSFDKFASEMAKLKNEKHFDYLVTIIGEDFGTSEGEENKDEYSLGCIYILENTETHERISTQTMAEKIDGEYYIYSISDLYKCAEMLEREVYDFYGIRFLGNKDMRRLFLRNDFKGYPFRKDYVGSEEYSLEYGTNTLSIHADSLKKGDKVVIVDDLLATGGTALAGAHLCERLGAEVVGMAFVIDLKDLNGRKLLKDYDVCSLLEYEGE